MPELAPEATFRTSKGILVLLEESRDLPLVNFELVLRTGATHEPLSKAGLARMTARMIRKGSTQVNHAALEEAIDRLGAQLSVQVAMSYVAFQGAVIARNIEPMFKLLGHLLRYPAFRVSDLQKLKREATSELIDMRDNDRALAFMHFRQALFGKHAYGRSTLGTESTLRAIGQKDIQRFHRKHYTTANLIVGLAGPLRRSEVARLLDIYFADLQPGRPLGSDIPEPKIAKGRRIFIVDKPERTQSQIVIGTLGTHFSDPDHDALQVANAAFGGTFTARLMREVRSKRGWSYGASSRLGHDRRRDAWWMWTFPELSNTIDCIRLQLELYDTLVRDGITKSELAFAKSYLINSYAFEWDTAAKRIDQRITLQVMGLPENYYANYLKRIRAVTLAQANAALKRRLSRDRLVVTVVSTAKAIENDLRHLPGVSTLRVLPWNH